MLEMLAARNPLIMADIRRDLPHNECLQARRTADLSIDDLVTGSFHISSLEGLAQGIPTLAFLDPRTLATLADMAGTSTHPWINCHLDDAENLLESLINQPARRTELGLNARTWMIEHWNDRDLIHHYTDAYAHVLESDGSPFPARFDHGALHARWETSLRHDLAWQMRRWRHHLRASGLSRLFSRNTLLQVR